MAAIALLLLGLLLLHGQNTVRQLLGMRVAIRFGAMRAGMA